MKDLLSQLDSQRHPQKRLWYIGLGLIALGLIFIFQQFSYSRLVFIEIFGCELTTAWEFSANKIIRFPTERHSRNINNLRHFLSEEIR